MLHIASIVSQYPQLFTEHVPFDQFAVPLLSNRRSAAEVSMAPSHAAGALGCLGRLGLGQVADKAPVGIEQSGLPGA